MEEAAKTKVLFPKTNYMVAKQLFEKYININITTREKWNNNNPMASGSKVSIFTDVS